MKAKLPMLVCILGLAGIAHTAAEPLAYEGFEYPSGSLSSDGAEGGEGWERPWESVQNAEVASDGKSLSYPAGVDVKTTGARLAQSGESSLGRALAPEVFSALDEEGGALYISLLVAKDQIPQEKDYLTFSVRSATPALPIVFFGLSSLEALRLSLFDNEGETGMLGVMPETCLMVLRLERTGYDLAAKLWVFDTNSQVPSEQPEADLEGQQTIPFEWKGILFVIEQGLNAVGQVDEIRFLKDWKDVTGGAK
jgi:hypothetical protein